MLSRADYAKSKRTQLYTYQVRREPSWKRGNFVSSVLIVDDDPGFTRLATLILRQEGFQVWQAANGEEGLQVLNLQEPDLVLLDLRMPKMDGRSFYRQARETGYKGRVIISSAFGAEEGRTELGADAALPKPFEPGDLVSYVNRALGIHPGSAWLRR